MSTHNIGFYEEISKNYHLIIIKYHQICTLFLLLGSSDTNQGENMTYGQSLLKFMINNRTNIKSAT